MPQRIRGGVRSRRCRQRVYSNVSAVAGGRLASAQGRSDGLLTALLKTKHLRRRVFRSAKNPTPKVVRAAGIALRALPGALASISGRGPACDLQAEPYRHRNVRTILYNSASPQRLLGNWRAHSRRIYLQLKALDLPDHHRPSRGYGARSHRVP